MRPWVPDAYSWLPTLRHSEFKMEMSFAGRDSAGGLTGGSRAGLKLRGPLNAIHRTGGRLGPSLTFLPDEAHLSLRRLGHTAGLPPGPFPGLSSLPASAQTPAPSETVFLTAPSLAFPSAISLRCLRKWGNLMLCIMWEERSSSRSCGFQFSEIQMNSEEKYRLCPTIIFPIFEALI